VIVNRSPADHDTQAPTRAHPAERNIGAIARLERSALHERTAADRLSDAISRTTGTAPFAIVHVVWFVGWLVICDQWYLRSACVNSTPDPGGSARSLRRCPQACVPFLWYQRQRQP
jgi:hypothetical protein